MFPVFGGICGSMSTMWSRAGRQPLSNGAWSRSRLRLAGRRGLRARAPRPSAGRPGSAATSVHLTTGVGPQPVELVERTPLPQHRPFLRAAIGARRPALPNQLGDLLVGGAVAERGPEIHAIRSVEAQIPGSVRSEPAPVAVAAERSRGGRDDPEAGTIGQPEPLRRRGR